MLLLSAAACGGSDGGGGSAGPGFQGALSVFEPDPTNLEAEPNDTLAQAHQLGDLRPGGQTSVVGSISAAGSDQLDIFEFQAPERVTIDVALADIAGGSGDLDVFIYDPVSLQIVQQAASLSTSETTSFVARGTFFVVVDVTGADADYELSLSGRAASGFQEFEPNDTLAQANYLGTLALGEVVTVQADGADPGSDVYLFSIPVGLTLSFRLTATDPQGDYEVDLFDVTQGIGSAMFLERFDSGPPVESGQRAASPMSLYALEVFPFEPNDVSSYTLEIANGVLSLQGVTVDAPARRKIAKRSTAAVAAAFAKDPVQLEGIFRAPGPVCRGDVIVQFEDDRPSHRPGHRRGPGTPHGCRSAATPLQGALRDRARADRGRGRPYGHGRGGDPSGYARRGPRRARSPGPDHGPAPGRGAAERHLLQPPVALRADRATPGLGNHHWQQRCARGGPGHGDRGGD